MSDNKSNYLIVVRQPESLNGIPFQAEANTIVEARKQLRIAFQNHMGKNPHLTLNNNFTLDNLPAAAVLTNTYRQGRLMAAKASDGTTRVLEIINLNTKKR